MTPLEQIKQQITENPILLYMKGTPEQPKCGFSARAVDALTSCGAQFKTVDVLSNLDIRQTLPQYSNWPTFPQLYLKGELIGGCDIILELQATGELQQLIKGALQ